MSCFIIVVTISSARALCHTKPMSASFHSAPVQNCMECVLFLFSCTKEKWRHRGVVYSLHDHRCNEFVKLWLWLDHKPSASSTVTVSSGHIFVVPLFCCIMLVVVQEMGVPPNVEQSAGQNACYLLQPCFLFWDCPSALGWSRVRLQLRLAGKPVVPRPLGWVKSWSLAHYWEPSGVPAWHHSRAH